MANKEKTLMGYSGAAANGLLNNYLPLIYPYARAALNPYEDIGEVEASIEQSYQDYPEAYIPAAIAGTGASMFGPGAYLKMGGKLVSAAMKGSKLANMARGAGVLGKYGPKIASALEVSPQVAESLLATTTPFLKKPEEEKMGEFDLDKRTDMVTHPINLMAGAFGVGASGLASRAERQAFDTLKAGAKASMKAGAVDVASPVSKNTIGRKMLDGGYWSGLPSKLLDKASDETSELGKGVGNLVDEADDIATKSGITMNRKNIIDYLNSEKARLFGNAEHTAKARDGRKIFDSEIDRIKSADPKTIKQWWVEKSAADNAFDSKSVYANYEKALSRGIRKEIDNVTGELATRSKAGLLQTPDITQYSMKAADEVAPHLQKVDNLLGMNNRAVAPINKSVAPLVDGATESLGASDDVINMTKGMKPGTPLKYEAGKYSDSSGKYATMRVIEDALERNANRSLTSQRKFGVGKSILGGLIGDFSYGLTNNAPKYSAKGIDILSKAAKNSKVGNALLAQEYGDRYIPSPADVNASAEQGQEQAQEQQFEVGEIQTNSRGEKFRFKGGDNPKDKNNWEQVQ